MKRKTHEEFIDEIKIVNPDIDIIGRYENSKKHIDVRCKRCGTKYSSTPNNLLCGKKCRICSNKDNGISKMKTNEQFLKELNDLDVGIIALEIYKGKERKIKFQCKNGHMWLSRPHDILQGYYCPFCAGNKVLKGFNDMWTTNPDIANMLYDKNIGYEVSKGSNQKLEFVCPKCGHHKFISPHQIIKYGLACPVCSDGISYPNKFIMSLLSQLDVINLESEYSPDWIGKLRYDTHFFYNNKEYIVEMDGGLGHGFYNCDAIRGIGLNGKDLDEYKDKMALEHNIFVIRIDCFYTKMEDRFSYIKNSIQNSELSNIFDLSYIDYDKCNKYATDSLSIKSANLYDEGLSIKEISEKLNISYGTVYSWLKRLSSEGLCSYKPIKGNPKYVKHTA